MRQHTTIAVLVLSSVAMILAGCGNGSTSEAFPPPPVSGNPTPAISSLSPTTVVAGGGDFTLTVNGSNFTSSTSVIWNVNPVATSFVNSQQLKATIPSGLVASAAYTIIKVQTGSFVSNIAQFLINSPAPQVTSISPDNAMAGSAPFVLTVTGSGFLPGAFVLLNGSPDPIGVAASTPTQLQTAIPLSDLVTAGSITISVANPEPAVGPSNQITFAVTPITSNPVPALTSALDPSVPAGWPGFRLHVRGSNFVAASVLQWNGVDRPTAVISSTELAGAIPADQLASPGMAQVSVRNPSPGGGGSGTLPIQIKSVSSDATGVIERSDIGNDLTEADGISQFAVVSGDGRFVAFVSSADNLGASSSEPENLFLRDTCIGAPTGCVPSLTFIFPVIFPFAAKPAISANGRFVAFNTDTGILLYDSCGGAPSNCVPSTRTVDDQSNGEDGQIALSADGRFAAFFSGDFNCPYLDVCSETGQFFLADTCAGTTSSCTPSSQAVSPLTGAIVETGDGNGNLDIVHPSISPDGRFIALNINNTQLALYDSCQGAGASCSTSTTMISVAGDAGPADGMSYGPSPSADGRYVAFLSSASNLVAGNVTPGIYRVYVRDMCTGAPLGCTPATTLIAVAGDGTEEVSDPSISADGRYVAYMSGATDLVPGDTNGAEDIFVLDTCAGVSTGCLPSTLRVSVALDGTQAMKDSYGPMISSDGHFVVFSSPAKLGPGNPSRSDIYLSRH